MINADDFKMRASMAGILMGTGGVKARAVQTYLENWIKEQIFGEDKEFTSKYTDKGNEMEDKAIDFIVEHLDLPFVMKNEESFEDEYFTGTPDVILPEETYDIKCSWDSFTFPLFETLSDKMKSKNVPYADFRNYYYQGQVYMHFTGAKRHTVAYCLMDSEGRYDDVPPELRIKKFSFDYEENAINVLQGLVIECRQEIKSKLKLIGL